MSIEDRVKKIVSDQLGTSLDEIQSDSSFVDDLGADSLDTVELVMALEEEFDLESADEVSEAFAVRIDPVIDDPVIDLDDVQIPAININNEKECSVLGCNDLQEPLFPFIEHVQIPHTTLRFICGTRIYTLR